MENINFLDNIAQRLGQTASVRNVYGEPKIVGDKTIIPVAQIMYGFGGGYGYGRTPKKFSNPENVSTTNNNEQKSGEGFGGGGGVVARPKGVYEISKQGTRFIPANNTRKLIAALLIGILIKSLIKRR